MTSKLEIIDSKVLFIRSFYNMSYDQNLSPEKENLKLKIDIKINKDDNSLFQIQMTIINQEDIKKGDIKEENLKNIPFYYEMLISGYFKISKKDDNEDKNEVNNLICLNGSSILYGVARGYLMNISSMFPNGTYILPVYNFVEYFNNEKNKK